MPGEQLHVHSACVRAICRPPRPASGDYNPEGALGEDNTSKYLHLGQLLINTKVYPDGPADVPQAAERMTKLKDGLAVIGSKDENIKVPRHRKDPLRMPSSMYTQGAPARHRV